MSEYAKEIHDRLKDYKDLELIIDNPRVEKFRAFGFNAINLSGIIITKSSGLDINDTTALITISEVDAVNMDSMVLKTTDYLRFMDGEFSEVDQNIIMIDPGHTPVPSTLKSAVKTFVNARNEYLELESNKADDEDLIKCESNIIDAVGLAQRIISNDESFKASLGEYGPQEHKYLMQKLGSLVLDLDAFYGPKN